MNYVLASATHIGKRDGNEDNCFVAARAGIALAGAEILDSSSAFDLVAIVADGMGGGAYGEAASQIAVETVRTLFAEGGYVEWAEANRLGFVIHDPLGLLREVVREIHQLIVQESTRRNVGKMGSTAVIMLAKGDQYWFAHVGDSRLYHQDGSGKISQCTEDHNMAAHGGKANQVYKILGCDSPHPDLGTGTVSDGDTFLLCTDGITLVQPVLSTILSAPEMTPETACDALVDLGVRQGGERADNATCIVVKVDSNFQSKAVVEKPPKVMTSPQETPPISSVKRGRSTLWVWFVLVAVIFYGLGFAVATASLKTSGELASERSDELLTRPAPLETVQWEVEINNADSLAALTLMENEVPSAFRGQFNRKLSELRSAGD